MLKTGIKFKIAVIVAELVVACLVIAGVGIIRLGNLNRTVETITKKYVEKAFMAKDMESISIDLKNQDKVVIMAEADKIGESLKRLDELESQMRMTLSDYQSVGVSDDEKKGITTMTADLDAWKVINKQVRDLIAAGKKAEAAAIVVSKSTETLDKLWETSEILMKTQQQLVADEVIMGDKLFKKSRIILLSASIGSILLALIIAGFIVTRMVKSLENVTAELNQSSNAVAEAATKVVSSSQILMTSTSEETAALQTTAASLEQMEAKIENNVQEAERGLQTSTAVIGRTKEGNDSMAGLRKSMEQILESNKRIEKLVNVIEEIGEKTAIIDEIVFQTKLLSFNASVEAERAGEHGRGFAVVAQEVGNLARLSGGAALEISSIVKQSTKEAKLIADDNHEKVVRGSKQVEETAKILVDIQKLSHSVLEGSSHIVTASKEQTLGIKEINNAMGSISKASMRTATTSEEVADAGVKLHTNASGLDQMVNKLNTIVKGKSESVMVSPVSPDVSPVSPEDELAESPSEITPDQAEVSTDATDETPEADGSEERAAS